MGVKTLAVVADDAGGFLAAVLQGVEAECGEGGGVGVVPDAEDATFLVHLVVVVIVGWVHQSLPPARRAKPCGVRCRSAPEVGVTPGGGSTFGA